MKDPRIEKLADLIVNYSIRLKAGDKVYVRASTAGAPLIEALYVKILQAGGLPYLWNELPSQPYLFFQYGSEEQIRHIPDPNMMLVTTYDAYIRIEAEENTRDQSQVDPVKARWRSQAVQDYMGTLLKRMGDGSLRYLATIFPTQAQAMDAEMSLEQFEDLFYRACLPDMDDPVGYWERFSRWQNHIISRLLSGKRKIRVEGPGTELSLDITGRTFLASDGRVNLPDGEIFTSPVEDSAEGHVTFSYPGVTDGREISGIQLWFEKGKVVKAAAEKNEAFLQELIRSDEGASLVGEFAIGTNEAITRFTGNGLFDEKIAGTFHLALGAGFPEVGGKNESGLHWDLVSSLGGGGRILADGEPIYEDGRFLIDHEERE
jgi:aminopeptidase